MHPIQDSQHQEEKQETNRNLETRWEVIQVSMFKKKREMKFINKKF